VSEQAHAAEAFGVRAGLGLGEGGRERATLVVRKYDADAVAWTSKRLGGGRPGRPGFIDPGPQDFARFGVDPYDVSEAIGNLFTQAGWGRLLTLGVGGGGTAYASATCRIGVGTGTAAAATGQTDLTAATGSANRWFNLVTGVGTTGTGTGSARLTLVATFASGDANFANPWQEWCIDQGTASGVFAAATATMLNRAVANLGTKVSPAVWTASALLDFT
jgi:hypothetical protein